MKKNRIIYLLIALFLLCVIAMVTGSSILGYSIGPGFPASTLIAWYIIAIMPYLLFVWLGNYIKKHTFFRKPIYTVLLIFLQLSMLIGIAWGFLGYGIAGNWAFNFKNNDDAYLLWRNITNMIVTLPIAGTAGFWLVAGIDYLRQKRKP